MQTTRSMKKKRSRRSTPRRAFRKSQAIRDYLVVVKSWMFLVAFALMLGLGALIGTFVNEQLKQSSPQVAGYSTQAR